VPEHPPFELAKRGRGPDPQLGREHESQLPVGELGLLDRSSAPGRVANRTAEDRVQAIAALRRTHRPPARGPLSRRRGGHQRRDRRAPDRLSADRRAPRGRRADEAGCIDTARSRAASVRAPVVRLARAAGAIYRPPTECQPGRGQLRRNRAMEIAMHEYHLPYHLVPPGHPGAGRPPRRGHESSVKTFRRAAAEAAVLRARLHQHQKDCGCGAAVAGEAA
jgi:hypothetical protein